MEVVDSMWESMQSWLTPTILFLLLNLMIATIALISSSSNPPNTPHHHHHHDDSSTSSLHKSPPSSSLFHRLRSVNLSSFKPHLPEQPHHQCSLDDIPTINKSATMKSPPSAHFQNADDVAAVEARRPATVRERGKKNSMEGDEEVDAKADDFINRFKNQLKLQRIDSFVRYKETVRHGAGAN